MTLKNTFNKRIFTQIIPNLLLVGGVVTLIRFDLMLLGGLLIVISKWQILRGGHRLWLRNLRDGGCDLVVASSGLGLMILAREDLLLTLIIGGLYALWLIVIKPMSGPTAVAVQAAICQFAGLWLVFLLGREMIAAALIAASWLISVVAADHLLIGHNERAHGIITFGWGVLVAELSWLFWQWLVTYSFWGGRLLVPQGPVIIGLLSYIFGSMYLDHTQAKLRRNRLVEYLVLCFGLCAAIIIGTKWDLRI